MSAIGHNSQRMTLAEAADANVTTGVHLLCKEALVTAIQDKRLERGHLRVLAAIVMHMNARAMAWPGRLRLALDTGLAVKTISNVLLELRAFGYLIADREVVPEADNKRLTVYTFGNIDHDTLRRCITEWVESVRANGARPAAIKSPPTGNTEVPAHGEHPRLRGTPTSPPTGNIPAYGEQIPEKQPEKSPPAGDSKKKEKDNSSSGSDQGTSKKRGTRLPEDWVLSPALTAWTLDCFSVPKHELASEVETFIDYWTSKDSQATKLDWDKTWKNWAKRSFKKYYRPRFPLMVAQARPSTEARPLDEVLAEIRAEDGEC